MKTKSFFFSIVIAAFLSSSIPSGSHSLSIGNEAPAITLSQGAENLLQNLKGKKMVVNFWSTADASSRIANRELSMLAESGKFDEDTRFISICIDRDSSLSEEIVRLDGISDKVISLGLEHVSREVLDDYQTEKGCRAFHIDSYGILRNSVPSRDVAEIIS